MSLSLNSKHFINPSLNENKILSQQTISIAKNGNTSKREFKLYYITIYIYFPW